MDAIERIAAHSSVLTAVEARSLNQYERTIERGIASFTEVGAALMSIRDEKLYRQSHKTFDDYVKVRWGRGRHWAYQLIDASLVIENVEHAQQKTPSNVRQATQLARVPKEDQAEVWAEVVESAPRNSKGEPQVTAKLIEETVDRWKTPNVEVPVIDDDEPQMYDELEQVVPTNLIRVFHDGEMVDQTIGLLKAAVKSAGELHSSTAGKFFNVKQFRSLAKEMQKLLEATRPFAICPYCEGRKCSACAHVGIVPKEVHQQAQ